MNQRTPIDLSRSTLQIRKDLETEASQIIREDGRGDLVTQREAIKFWEENRPDMVRRLGPETVNNLALVLTHRMHQAVEANLRAGMYSTDARERAERDWMLMEPEEEA